MLNKIFNLFRHKVIPKFSSTTRTLFSKEALGNIGISVVLAGTGDLVVQNFEFARNNERTWDRSRTNHMAISGLTTGFVCHHWYNILDKKLPGRTPSVIVKKVIADQLICSPICIAIFFITIGYLENCCWKQLKREMVNKGIKLYIFECITWPPLQVINFYYVPSRYRMVYNNTVSFFHDIYSSFIKYEEEEDDICPEDCADNKSNNRDHDSCI